MSRKERRQRASNKFQDKQQKALDRVKGRIRKMSQRAQQIQQQYGDLCMRAGELQYKIVQDETRLKEINQRIMMLNKEFHELRLAEKPEQQAPASEAPVEQKEEAPSNASEKKD